MFNPTVSERGGLGVLAYSLTVSLTELATITLSERSRVAGQQAQAQSPSSCLTDTLSDPKNSRGRGAPSKWNEGGSSSWWT